MFDGFKDYCYYFTHLYILLLLRNNSIYILEISIIIGELPQWSLKIEAFTGKDILEFQVDLYFPLFPQINVAKFIEYGAPLLIVHFKIGINCIVIISNIELLLYSKWF